MEVDFNRAGVIQEESLLSLQVPVHFDPKSPVLLVCDASSYGIEAVTRYQMVQSGL